ncbi:MAG: Fic family protein [Bryobacteraceae bacterium]
MPIISYKWKEISDLPDDADSLRDRELESLLQMWDEQRRAVADAERIKEFNAQLAREWAIETGIIEGVYTLERGVTQILIERGIDSAHIPHDATNRDPELVARTIRAHEEVLEGLFAFVRGERDLSTSYVKELHSALLRYQNTVVVFDQSGQPFETKLERGVYKTQPNSPLRADGSLHEYCPPEHVASEMDRLIELHHKHAGRRAPPYVQAAWLHHAFTQIHPFQDGNGRVARALATLVLIKAGLLPLVVSRDQKERYIEALEAADEGQISRLFDFFAQVEKRALTKAIGSAADVKPVKSIEEAFRVTRDLLVDTGRIIPSDYLRAKATANVLLNLAVRELQTLRQQFQNEVTAVDSSYQFKVNVLATAPHKDLAIIAAKLQYDLNTNDYHHGVQLEFSAGSVVSRIVVSLHGVGAAFRGVLVSSAYFYSGEERLIPLCDDVFRISFEENPNEASTRFRDWLSGCLIKGLAEWRRTLA